MTDATAASPWLCRDCLRRGLGAPTRCAGCGGPRLTRHAELFQLSIAHVDCDAFYAAVEKRDDPELRDKPVIVGGGRRGVVSAACYIARAYGVRSAMPMFKALKACRNAVVLRPDMQKYAAVSAQIRALMSDLTPLVQPISIDEAFLDLSGTERLHKAAPAACLAKLARAIERDVGVTVSVGLSHNKFLAKIASDLDKPRGFCVIGRAETIAFLSERPVSLIWGVGPKFQARLEADGYATIGSLQRADPSDLARRYGEMGLRLARLARGDDARPVRPPEAAKSISSETTFPDDIADPRALADRLWPLCEKVAARAKTKGVAGKVVTLKLKTADFQILTRRRTLPAPTALARRLFQASVPLIAAAADHAPFRLIGVGLSELSAPDAAAPGLFDEDTERRESMVERAVDDVRAKFGGAAIDLGRAFAAQQRQNLPRRRKKRPNDGNQ